ncbi:MAG: hypothetical protein MRY83_19935 [Flavobacteriales bacterium]|nr:hypothetical protein [Flavobacteriales bacterium]
MNMVIAHIKGSFKITGRGVVVFIEHGEEGLPSGIKLISVNTNRTWLVKSRVLCDHAIGQHKIFPNETMDYAQMRFASEEKRLASIHKIKREESLGIYQYMITPVDHDEKPEEGEILNIEMKTTTNKE